MIAAAVIQIDGKQDAIMLGTEFEDELLFALNAEHAIGITENVRPQADFQAVFEPLRVGLLGGTRRLGFS